MRKVLRRKQDMVEREIALTSTPTKRAARSSSWAADGSSARRRSRSRSTTAASAQLAGSEIVLNLGSHAAIPDVPGLDAARPLTHIEMLELDTLPSHLIVLGGGYVGVETAQTFRRFGARVTIIEPGPQLMGREDPDVAQEIRTILTGEGVEVVLNAHPVSVNGLSGEAVA